MWKIIPYAVLQSLLLVGGQVFLKFAMMRMLPFAWTRTFWVSLLTNWHFAACGLFFGAASLLWMYIVKVFPFSMAYPMVSLSYVFGMFARGLHHAGMCADSEVKSSKFQVPSSMFQVQCSK